MAEFSGAEKSSSALLQYYEEMAVLLPLIYGTVIPNLPVFVPATIIERALKYFLQFDHMVRSYNLGAHTIQRDVIYTAQVARYKFSLRHVG